MTLRDTIAIERSIMKNSILCESCLASLIKARHSKSVKTPPRKKEGSKVFQLFITKDKRRGPMINHRAVQ